MLSRNGGDAVKESLPAFQKALELKPDYAEARVQFGLMLVNTRNYPEAIVQLNQVKKIDPEQAQWYFPALAFAYLQTGDKEKAREYAEAARKWAKTEQQLDHADALLRSLESRSTTALSLPPGEKAPTIRRVERSEFAVVEEAAANPFVDKDDKMKRVQGVAQRLDCSGKAARFHVLVDKAPMIFLIPDPGRVLIKHSGEFKHDFTCGVQKPYKVSVDYASLPDTASGAAGIVRGLEF
jgi:hypothetical protein